MRVQHDELPAAQLWLGKEHDNERGEAVVLHLRNESYDLLATGKRELEYLLVASEVPLLRPIPVNYARELEERTSSLPPEI